MQGFCSSSGAVRCGPVQHAHTQLSSRRLLLGPLLYLLLVRVVPFAYLLVSVPPSPTAFRGDVVLDVAVGIEKMMLLL